MSDILVSIVIPTLNEERHLPKCLDSILAQTYDQKNIEVMIVNGMSEDKTWEIINSYTAKYSNFKLLSNELNVTTISLNIGIKHASGDIITILGAHAFLDPNFIANNVRNITQKNVDCSGGVVQAISEDEISRCVSVAVSSHFGMINAMFRHPKREMFVETVAFGTYNRKSLERINYFDENLVRNQDDELNFRLRHNGGKILLSPDIVSYYYSRSSLDRLWTQYYQYGFWKVCVLKKHNRPTFIRHLFPAVLVLAFIVGGMISLFFPSALWAVLGVVLIYFLIDVLMSLKLSRINQCSLMNLTAVFPTMHTAFGLGFVIGFVYFVLFRRRGYKIPARA